MLISFLNFQLATRLHEFAEWKDVECPYKKNPTVAEFLQTFPVLEEDGKKIYSQ
jgi:hypothetical protein